MNANQRWLKQQEDLRVEREAQAKPFFATFDEYVAAYPDGETWRNWVGEGSLVPSYYSCLPGGYWVATIKQWPSMVNGKRTGPLETWLCLNNGDDGMCKLRCQDEASAQREMDKLKLLAPLHYWALKDFGEWEDFN